MKIRILLILSILFLILGWSWSLKNEGAKIIFCDVGQGDGILVTKKNWQMLVDTGPNNKKILTCLEKYMPFWDKTLEVVLVTHGDSDHSGGLADVLKSYKTVDVFSNDDLKALNEQKISSKKMRQNDILKMGLFSFEVENPRGFEKNGEDNNTTSIAGILSYKTIKILLTADITSEVEQRLVWQNLLPKKIDILKVAHHGSAAATSDELLDFVKPQVGVISVGAKNRFGHPRKEVLERLQKRGIKIERTDFNGDVVMNLDN